MDRKEAINRVEREMDSLSISLLSKVAKSAVTLDEYISIRTRQGASAAAIKADLLDDLNNGGRIFGEFRNGIKATANGTIHRFRDIGQVSEHGYEQNYKWAAVLVNTCPDCEVRHGVEKSYEEWERAGLPRTLQTICKEYCRCMLIPADMTVIKGENIKPIKRKRGRR